MADAEDAVTPEQIDTLNALMLQKLLLFREQAQRLEEAQATDEAKAALLAEIRASLKVESDTLERMAGHFEDGREAAPAGSGP